MSPIISDVDSRDFNEIWETILDIPFDSLLTSYVMICIKTNDSGELFSYDYFVDNE